MASQPVDLKARITLLKRDFPTFPSATIKSVLVGQNYEVARARIHLALAKKQYDQEKAQRGSNEGDGGRKFESPFALASQPKDRTFSLPPAPIPKSTREPSSQLQFVHEIDLDSSFDSSRSEHSSSQVSSQSSSLSHDLNYFYSTHTSSKGTKESVHYKHTVSSVPDAQQNKISPFASSKSPVPSLVHQPTSKKQPSIPDLFKKAAKSKEKGPARQTDTTNTKKRMRSFFDDIMDIPESFHKKQDEFVEDIDDEIISKPKRKKLEIGSSASSSRISQTLSRKITSHTMPGSKISQSMDSTSKKRHSSHNDISNHNHPPSPPVAPVTLHTTHQLQDRTVFRELSSDDDLDHSDAGANDSRSSEATVILPSQVESSQLGTTTSHPSFNLCSQVDARLCRQTPSRRIICESSDDEWLLYFCKYKRFVTLSTQRCDIGISTTPLIRFLVFGFFLFATVP